MWLAATNVMIEAGKYQSFDDWKAQATRSATIKISRESKKEIEKKSTDILINFKPSKAEIKKVKADWGR